MNQEAITQAFVDDASEIAAHLFRLVNLVNDRKMTATEAVDRVNACQDFLRDQKDMKTIVQPLIVLCDATKKALSKRMS